jgi:hypothetical protein
MDKWVGVVGGGAMVTVLGVAGMGFGLLALLPAGALLMAIGFVGIALEIGTARTFQARFRPMRRIGFCVGHHFFGA